MEQYRKDPCLLALLKGEWVICYSYNVDHHSNYHHNPKGDHIHNVVDIYNDDMVAPNND